MSLKYEKNGRIAIFTLDHPPVNVWTPDTHKALYDAVLDFTEDDNLNVGILTSTGDKYFSAGDDIKTPRPARSKEDLIRRHLEGVRSHTTAEYPGWEAKVMAMPRTKPIIAAVYGKALGQGFLYLNIITDIRIVADNAVLGMPEVKYGMTGAGAAMHLSRAMPYVDAMYILLTGELITAQKAREMHIINEVVAPQNVMPRAMEIAEIIASHDRLAIQVEMDSFQRSADMSRDNAIALAGHMFRLIRSVQPDGLPLSKEAQKDHNK